MRAVKHFLLALQFFTRIPITGRLAAWVGFSPAMLRASAAHFAGVGWVVGAVAAVVWLAANMGVSGRYGSLVAGCLCVVATAWLTGGFHEDGLADLADGLGGSLDRTRALEIMKDSRIGSFGALALILGVFTKIALLAAWGDAAPQMAIMVVLASHVVSRAFPMGVVALMPHVGDAAGSKSRPLADEVSAGVLWSNAAWCTLLLVPVYAAGALAQVLAGVLGAGLAWAILVWRLKRRLQGFTGDALGACQQLCEIAFVLAALLAVGAA